MKREVAHALLPIVNLHTFPRAIKAYVDERVDIYQSRILVAKSFEEVKELTGRIQEVKDLLKLPELVENNKG